MAQVVDPAGEAGLRKDRPAGTGEVGGPPGFTVGPGEDELTGVEARAHAQAHLKPCPAVFAQGLGGDLRQGEGTRAARRLRLLEGDASGGLLQAATHQRMEARYR